MNEQPNWREVLNKEWSKDFSTLTNQEVQKLIKLAFYQLFLVEIDEIQIANTINSTGHYVRFILEGEAYRDGANVQNYEINEEE
jgi:hypothetical protein